MNVHGDKTEGLPTLDPGLAAATLAAFAHRHEVVHLLYTAADEADALARIAQLLQLDQHTVSRVLDQPLRRMLPEHRAVLDLATTQTVITPRLDSTSPVTGDSDLGTSSPLTSAPSGGRHVTSDPQLDSPHLATDPRSDAAAQITTSG